MSGRAWQLASCTLRGTSHFVINLAVALVAVGLCSQAADARSHAKSHAASQARHSENAPPPLTADTIEQAQWSPGQRQGKNSPVIFKAEVLLDRAGFSPGEIDAHDGDNFGKALRAYQQVNELDPTGKLDQATWQALTKSSDQPVTRDYTITADDAKGPFADKIPAQFDQMAKLKQLGYRSPEQRIAEEFHMSPDALTALNKGADLKKDGTKLVVANVAEMALDGGLAAEAGKQKAKDAGPAAARVEVDKASRAVRVFDRDSKLLAFYPASIGSTEKPAPSGKFSVKAISLNPTYHYNPKYAFKGQKAKSPVTVPPGPKNPVGLVWIDLSAQSYGIHGTPAPANISKTESHGCIRLTNWDALALAKLVKRGTPVEFVN